MGYRIRVIGGPWPGRIGQEGVLLDRPAGPDGRIYPWSGRGPGEVIVLLDSDTSGRGWTCVFNRCDVDAIRAINASGSDRLGEES